MVIRWVAIGLAALGILTVAWFASEQHYDNCLTAAIAAHPLGENGLTAADKVALPSKWAQYRNGGEIDFFDSQEDADLTTAIFDRPRVRRARAVDSCSRLPF